MRASGLFKTQATIRLLHIVFCILHVPQDFNQMLNALGQLNELIKL